MPSQNNPTRNQTNPTRRLSNLWQVLTQPQFDLQDRERWEQARFQNGLILSFLLICILGLVMAFWGQNKPAVTTLAIIVPVLALAYALSRSGFHRAAAWLAVGIWCVVIWGILIRGGENTDQTYILLAFMPIAFALGSALLRLSELAMLLTGLILSIGAITLFSPLLANAQYMTVFSTLACLGSLTLVTRQHRNRLETQRLQHLSDTNHELEQLRHFLEERVEELNQAQFSLQQTQSLLVAVIEQTPVGLMVAEGAQRERLIINPAAADILTGIRPPLEECVSVVREHRWQPMRPNGEHYTTDELPLAKAARFGETQQDVEIRIRREDGSERWVLASAAPLHNAEGELIGGVTMFPDITSRKLTEQALQQSEQMMREFQEKLKNLHEVNLELAVIHDQAEFYYQAIALGRSKLGFDRMGLFLLTEDNQTIQGTFGTDDQGLIRDERYFKRPVTEDPAIVQLLEQKIRTRLWENVQLVDNTVQVGHGWNAMAAIWDGDQAIGWLAVDNLLSGQPHRPYTEELLLLYGTTLGHLLRRKEYETSLRMTQERYRNYIELSIEGIAMFAIEPPIPLDLPHEEQVRRIYESAYVVDCNESLTRMYGFSTRDELIGRAILDFTNQTAQDKVNQANLEFVRNGYRGAGETIEINHQGQRVYFYNTSAGIVRDGYLVGIWNTQLDISDLKRAEQALRASQATLHEFQERLKTLNEIHLELAALPSLDDLYRQAIILGRNRLGFDRLGLILLDSENMQMQGTYGTDARGELRDERHFRQAVGQDSAIIQVLQGKERTHVWHDATLWDEGEPIGTGWSAMAAIWDGDRVTGWLAADNLLLGEPLKPYVQELLLLYGANLGQLIRRKTAEEGLRTSEERFSKAFRASPDSIAIATVKTGRIVDVNYGFESMFGYTRQEALGRQVLELNIWADVGERMRMLEKLQAEGSVKDLEVRFNTRLGEQGIGLFSAEMIELNGESCLVAITRDITGRKQIEQEIQQLNAQLEQRVSQRTAQLEAANRELEAFSYSVSHDLRAPLRSISGFARILVDDYSQHLQGDARFYLQRIDQNATRMGMLIDDLLAFSRLGRAELHKVSIDPTSLVRQIVDELHEPQRVNQVEIRVNPMPKCLADPSLLRQAYTNLVGNALKFTRHTAQALVEIGAEQQHGQTIYWVRDNGAGFDMAYAGKLFGVFERLHRQNEYEGTGVGLAIVQRIILRHGGRIWAQAEPGKGATFFFTLEDRASAPSI